MASLPRRPIVGAVAALAVLLALAQPRAVAQEAAGDPRPAGGPALAVPVQERAGAGDVVAPEAAGEAGADSGEGQATPGEFTRWLYDGEVPPAQGDAADQAGTAGAGRASAGRGLGWIALDLGMWLGIVLLLAVGALWALRRFMPGGQGLWRSGPLTVLGRVTLTPKHSVYLLRVGRRVLVVGMGQDGLRTLAQLDNADEVAAVTAEAGRDMPGTPSAAFQEVLASAALPAGAGGAGGDGGAATAEAAPETGVDRLQTARREVEDLHVLLSDVRKRLRKAG